MVVEMCPRCTYSGIQGYTDMGPIYVVAEPCHLHRFIEQTQLLWRITQCVDCGIDAATIERYSVYRCSDCTASTG